VLQPYITVLPNPATTVNLNTASAEVIYAAVPGLGMADAQRLVAERDRTPFKTTADAARFVSNPELFTNNERAQIGFGSRYFEVRGRLRLGDTAVEERSVVVRDGIEVKTVWRERGVVDPTALTRAATSGR
jgi:general secretion pathway protein K